mgnify:CR=1 FL=1
MADINQLSLQDYIDIAKRRWLHFLVPFVVASMGAAALAVWLPPIYASKGTILIESQQVPDDLVRSTVTSYADERIQVIQQLVMTRENLLRIIREYNLFPELRSELTLSEQIDLIRERIRVSKVASGLTGRNSRSTIAFSVGFEDADPGKAYSVANELLTLFLEENVRTRTARATETTEFLKRQAETLRTDLERIELEIAQYKQENGDALPEHLDMHMSMLERTEDRIKTTELSIRSAEDQLRILQIERSALLRGTGAADDSQGGNFDVNQTLPEAEAKLSQLLSVYTPRHPDVRRQQSLVERLRAAEPASADAESADDGATAVAAGNPALARIEVEIVSTADRIDALRLQAEELTAERSRLEAIIIETPQVQRQLTSLMRDYDNTRSKYQDIQAKEMEAKVAENLEEDRKAERFTLIEPATKPDKPIKPNRKKVALLGILLGAGLGAAFVFVLEAADQRVRGSAGLVRILGEAPLVQLPYIETLEERARRRRWLKRLVVMAVLGLVIIVAAVHFLYMPLDLLTIRIISRLG